MAQILFERLQVYLLAWIEQVGGKGMFAEHELFEGTNMHAFTLPDGTRVLFDWWGENVQSFVVPLAVGQRRVGRNTRMSNESGAQLAELLNRADQAAKAAAA